MGKWESPDATRDPNPLEGSGVDEPIPMVLRELAVNFFPPDVLRQLGHEATGNLVRKKHRFGQASSHPRLKATESPSEASCCGF